VAVGVVYLTPAQHAEVEAPEAAALAPILVALITSLVARQAQPIQVVAAVVDTQAVLAS
jgi:hypothetical protein